MALSEQEILSGLADIVNESNGRALNPGTSSHIASHAAASPTTCQ